MYRYLLLLIASSAYAVPFSSSLKLKPSVYENLRKNDQIEINLPHKEGELRVVLREQRLKLSGNYSVKLFSGSPLPRSGRNDFAKLSLFPDNEITGLYRYENVIYSIETSGDELLVNEYDPSFQDPGQHTCEAKIPEGYQPPPEPAPPTAQDGLRVIELCTQSDYPFFQRLGGETEANNRIIAIVNEVNGLTETDLGLTNRIVFQDVYTSADPYTTTDAGGLLTEFRTDWRNRHSQNCDNTHLFTDRNLDGSTVGIAWVSAICGTFSYAVNQYFTTNLTSLRALVAHEQGHNLGSGHTSAGVMKPSIGGDQSFFDADSKSQIASTTASASCLEQDTSSGGVTLTAPSPQTVIEGGSVSFDLSATDVNNQTITYTYSPTMTGAALSGNTFSYNAPSNLDCGDSIDHTITFTATDTDSNSDSKTMVLTVRDISFQQPPTLSSVADQVIERGSSYTLTLSATDSDGDQITYSSGNLPSGAGLDSSSGVFSWTPSGIQQTSITFRATDCAGNNDSITVSINVKEAPSAPLNLRFTE